MALTVICTISIIGCTLLDSVGGVWESFEDTDSTPLKLIVSEPNPGV